MAVGKMCLLWVRGKRCKRWHFRPFVSHTASTVHHPPPKYFPLSASCHFWYFLLPSGSFWLLLVLFGIFCCFIVGLFWFLWIIFGVFSRSCWERHIQSIKYHHVFSHTLLPAYEMGQQMLNFVLTFMRPAKFGPNPIPTIKCSST